ncbi:SCAN domain-containing protein 3-like [Onthophagus taurus]|uniref:SCAN domain-containing protein 3-like n=1 Tax=Onthophagus taurus TaxID=166361 RepID=UPI0039BE0C71
MALEITQAKQKNSKKSRREYYLLQMYDLMKVGDQQHVIKKVKEKNDPLIYIIPEEELFERLLDIHISCGHGSRDKMINIVQQKYFIPRPCVEMFLMAYFMTRGQVDLIDFQSIPDGEYKWLLNYQDHSTKYVCLRPLHSKDAVNVAEELLKIFLQFGAPSILQSDNGREFANKIVEELKILWPHLLIVHGRPRHPQSQGSVERSNQDVEKILRSWMTDNKSTRWSVGCYFTQWQKNNLLHKVIGRTPYKAVFGHDPKFGLKSTNLRPTILSNITTEEELENQEKEMGVFREEAHEQRCEEPVTEATKELGIELEQNELDTNEKIQNVDSISSDNMDCGIVELQMATKGDVVLSLIMDRWLQPGCSKRKVNEIQRTAPHEIIEDETSSKPVNKKARKTRKYDKEYLKLGFSWSGDEKEPIPLCVIYFENLTNESMKPSNLKRHFEYKDKPIEFFEHNLKALNQSQKVMRGLTGGDNQKILETSYRVSLLIAKCGAAETIGETLIKPAAKIMAEVMIGDKAKQTLDRVPLSNNTVHRRIIDMANNVKQMLLSDISQSRYYALQVD